MVISTGTKISKKRKWLIDEEVNQRAIIKHTKKATIKRTTSHLVYAKYKDDPIGFGKEVLGIKMFAPDVEAVLMSVVNNEVTLARSANSIGKTHAAALISIWGYKCFANAQVYTCAAPPEHNLDLLLWGEIRKIVSEHPELFVNDKFSSLHIENKSDPKNFITGLTIPSSGNSHQKVARFSGKHAPNLFFIADEGDGIPVEVYTGIESCMSGGNSRLLIPFNPHHESGPVYIKERDNRGKVIEMSALNHPNVITGNDSLIEGAVTRNTTVRRIMEWTRPLAQGEKIDNETVILPDFLYGFVAKRQDGTYYEPLTELVRKIIEPAFSFMVLGKYPTQATTQLISRAWVKESNARWKKYVEVFGEVPPLVKPLQGLDVAEFGNDKNVSTLKFGDFVAKPEFWQGVDTVVTAMRASEIAKKNNVDKVLVDGTGYGSGVAPLLTRDGINAYSIKVSSAPTKLSDLGAFFQLRDQMYWLVREWLRSNPHAMLPPIDELEEELCTPTYEIVNGKIKIMKKAVMKEMLGGRSPDFFDSLAMCFAEEDDKLLHFYDSVLPCNIKEGKVFIKEYNAQQDFTLELKELKDYGFIGMCQPGKEQGWAFIRVWINENGKWFIIPEIFRTPKNDPQLIARKIFEAHKKRPFTSVGIFADSVIYFRQAWNGLEEIVVDGDEIPDLVTIKNIKDRETRHMNSVKLLTHKRKIAVNTTVSEREQIWSQLSTYQSIPDDCREALSGVIQLVNRDFD